MTAVLNIARKQWGTIRDGLALHARRITLGVAVAAWVASLVNGNPFLGMFFGFAWAQGLFEWRKFYKPCCCQAHLDGFLAREVALLQATCPNWEATERWTELVKYRAWIAYEHEMALWTARTWVIFLGALCLNVTVLFASMF